MAQRYWGGDSPIGRRISPDEGRTWVTIVGVVADARQQLNAAARCRELYVPMFQSGQLSSNWLVRTTVDPVTHGAAGARSGLLDRSRISRSTGSGRWLKSGRRRSTRHD